MPCFSMIFGVVHYVLWFILCVPLAARLEISPSFSSCASKPLFAMPPKENSPAGFGSEVFRGLHKYDKYTFGAGLWQWFEAKSWWDMTDERNGILERALDLANPVVTLDFDDNGRTWTYEYDLVNYTQTNTTTGKVRPIRRVEVKHPIILP